MSQRFIGIDVGAETLKVVELTVKQHELHWGRRELIEHGKQPDASLLELLKGWDWDTVSGAAVVGRLGRRYSLDRVPEKQARSAGFRFLRPDDGPTTLVAMGSHGFSVLELRDRDKSIEIFRENSRCSQGTGNFLRQLVERFNLTIEEASECCADIEDPAPLSGRCPVILKTDMTHLANAGQDKERILAGLYDAVAENVQVLLKPGICPSRVMLMGGVSRADRVQQHFAKFLAKNEMQLVPLDLDAALFMDALGCAALAAEHSADQVPTLEALVNVAEASEIELPSTEPDCDGCSSSCGPTEKASAFELLPALADHLSRVRRIAKPEVVFAASDVGRDGLVLGLDIGSTGSKIVAVDPSDRSLVWESYLSTNGDPVGAAQSLVKNYLASDWSDRPIVAIGATGSGREIVGSLLTNCYTGDPVFVLNEIAAHAEGALFFDPTVDTIFEIGGQDAKYIRLSDGRVVDAAMNEACSAGTGSFIEEQGKRFAGIDNVIQLGEEALKADGGVSLGQHCSVFMAEVIDEATASGVEQRRIVAGIYDSIIQNYLNRVKGSRSVGEVVFCQGMPFASDALAAAAARQTDAQIIVPPNPGTIGALGIALLTCKERVSETPEALDLQRFLGASVVKKDNFICKSKAGCGDPGNRCRIERISTLVEEKRQRFTWGGNCSLFDKGTGRTKLPDMSPDPFMQREDLVTTILKNLREAFVARQNGTPQRKVACTDEFMLKSLFPFFASFFGELGFELQDHRGADQKTLKRGIEKANVPFCAPMQQYHGLIDSMAEAGADILFLPMLLRLPRIAGEENSGLCPIVQGAADMMRSDLGDDLDIEILSPVVDFGEEDLESLKFQSACRDIAVSLGLPKNGWRTAYEKSIKVQEDFDKDRLVLGEKALKFCEENGVTPVVVLGRPYTIYNKVLNSNVPAILREQGVMAIPVDCYPVAESVPVFPDVYWAFGQRNLRAAHQIREHAGVYSMWCSNYSCGPDSFNLHFYSYIMEGKPFAIIETDGHSGDAGTRTRVEAFLYCVKEDLLGARESIPQQFMNINNTGETLPQIRDRKAKVLFPRMGAAAETLAACCRGIGMDAECLPMPDQRSLRLGRRYTSGKECLPMSVTLGSLLKYLDDHGDSNEPLSFFMPSARGPCRFGSYHMLHKIILERLEQDSRVKLWSPDDSGYFNGIDKSFEMLVYAGVVTNDLIHEAYHDVRPAEREAGQARAIYDKYLAKLNALLEAEGGGNWNLAKGLAQVASGKLFGCASLLKAAVAEFAEVRKDVELPVALIVGEIYVRADPFCNDFVVERLLESGIRVRLAPFHEWLDYQDYINGFVGLDTSLSYKVGSGVQVLMRNRLYNIMMDGLDWHPAPSAKNSCETATPYVRTLLEGEAALTVGGPLAEWRSGVIDGVLNLGPLECMPAKIAEAQFFHVTEKEGVPTTTVLVNGEPIDQETMDNFIFEIKAEFRKKGEREKTKPARTSKRQAAGRALVQLGKGATQAVRPSFLFGEKDGLKQPEKTSRK